MDIKLELTGEQINDEIIAAITNSLIGEQLKKAIEKELERWKQSYNNPLEQIVAVEITALVRNLLLTTYKEKLEDAVKELITNEVIAKITTAAFNAMMEAVEKKYYR